MSVLLFHFTYGALPKIVYEPLRHTFSWGSRGVEIFFVISGFIIPYALQRSRYHIGDFVFFMGKRIVRICPPAYISLLLVVAQWWAIDHVLHSPNSYTSTLTVPRLVHNLLFTVGLTEFQWINGIFWTLAIEFQFYLLLGLLFTTLNKNTTYFLVLFAGILLASTSKLMTDHCGFLEFGELFVMGMATWLMHAKRIPASVFYTTLLVAAGVNWANDTWVPAAFGVATSLCIMHVQFQNRVATFFGTISYSLYLTHLLVGTTIEAIAAKVLDPALLINKLVILITCMVAAIIIAYLFYRFIETRFVALANRIGHHK